LITSEKKLKNSSTFLLPEFFTDDANFLMKYIYFHEEFEIVNIIYYEGTLKIVIFLRRKTSSRRKVKKKMWSGLNIL